MTFFAKFFFVFSAITYSVDNRHPVRVDCEAYIYVSDTIIQTLECDNYREFKVEKKNGKYYTSYNWYWVLDLPDIRVYEIVDEHSVLRKEYLVEEL